MSKTGTMRVVHLIKATRIGGAERHLLILLKALRERDIDAHLLLIVEGDNLMDNLVAEAGERDIPVQRVVIHGHLDFPVINRIRARLRALKPDILHTHLIHADTYGLIAGKLAWTRVILSSRHNDDAFRRNPAVQRVNRLLWGAFKGGIAISESMRQFTINVEGAPARKLRLVHYGIEHEILSSEAQAQARHALREELSLAADTTIVGLACRLIEQKGVSFALKALAQIQSEYDFHCVIAGDGPLLAALKREARQLGLESRTHFLGWRADVPDLLAGFDLFLMPSLWEGFGLVLLEAMSKRLPIIGSAVSAIPEVVVDGETGLLVPPRDPVALAEAVAQLLGDRALRAHMGLMAEDYLEQHFTAARMADETIVVYRDFLK